MTTDLGYKPASLAARFVITDLGYKPQCHDVASGRFPQEIAVTNASCSLLLGLSLYPVAQKVNAAILENEGGRQRLRKSEWWAGSSQGI